MKILIFIIVVLAILVASFFGLNAYIYTEKQVATESNYLDAEYLIEGQRIQLKNGVAETQSPSGSSSVTITQYFGNEIVMDLDADGDDDIAFILTQSTGGSGTFYYAVAAINTEDGYVGSDGYLLGDRIAPQTTEVSQNPRHKNVVVFNYANREDGAPMTTKPSIGQSVYLKLDPEYKQWGIVEPNFEGESNQDPL